jgi:hypothetical protein
MVNNKENLFIKYRKENYWNLWAAKAGVTKVMTEADVVLSIHDPQVVEKYGYEI